MINVYCWRSRTCLSTYVDIFEFLTKGGKCTNNLTNVVMDVVMNDEIVSKSNIALKLYSFEMHMCMC